VGTQASKREKFGWNTYKLKERMREREKRNERGRQKRKRERGET